MEMKFNIRERSGARGTTYMVDVPLPDGGRYRKTLKTHKQAMQEGRRKVAELRARAAGVVLEDPAPGKPDRMPVAVAIRDHIADREVAIADAENIRALKYIFEYYFDSLYEEGVDFVDQLTLKVHESIRKRWREKGISPAQKYEDESDADFVRRAKRRKAVPLSATTINRRFNAISAFLDHCVAWGYLTANPCARLAPLKGEAVERQPWPEGSFVPIVRACDEWCRNILMFIDDVGCRPKEAINLEESDVNLVGLKVRLRTGKGGGMVRWVPITEKQALFLAHVIADRKRHHPEQTLVFLRNGKKIHRNRISDQVREARRKLGLPDGIVPYGLRHGLITLLDEMGVGLKKIQSIAGHRRVETTLGYMHTPDNSLRNVVDMAEKRRDRRAVGT